MDALRAAIEKAIGNQYEVLHLIGRGGMGAVYLARDRFLDRLVAVKILPDTGDAEGRERFLREARTAAKLTHPSIVPLHTFSQVDDTLLYVMGYIEGESLESLLKREGRLPADRAGQIMSEIAGALDYAHAMGIVHRDVKPDNVLIDRDSGRAYLTDFGIAKAASGKTMTRTGMVVGTPHYMSPEQGSGDAVDGRSDLYALGVIGYRMLSGRLPFDAPGMQELMVQHATREPVPLEADQSSQALATVVTRCLRKAPIERWQSGAAVVTALQPLEPTALGLPEELSGLPSTMSNVLGLWIVFDVLLACVAVFSFNKIWVIMGAIGPVVTMPIVAASVIVSARRHGIGWRDALRYACMPPAGWTGWWPARLRRPGDVWSRLPAPIRRVRAAFTALNAFNVLLIPAMAYTMSRYLLPVPDMDYAQKTTNIVVGLSISTFVVLMGAMVSTLKWPKRFPVGKWASRQLISTPTWNSPFWKRPEVEAILSPAATPEKRFTRTADEVVGEIDRIVAALPSAIGPAASDAAKAARDVLALFHEVERELTAIERDADPAERARLESKVAALGESPMRDLLRQQLALHEQLEVRRRQLGDDRDRCLTLLKRVHLELARSRAELARDGASPEALSGQIRAVCRDLQIERSAVREAELVLGTPTPG
jgi:predicted Ser/Thr protein kinase